jgi:hypothetical protein
LANDLSEKHDLAKDQPDRVAAMRAKLHAWYKEMDAKFLTAKGDEPAAWRP